MIFGWNDFLELAETLPSLGEAGSRTAISRAYYAVYCSARDRLTISQILIPTNADAHGEVKEYFDASNDFDSKKIAEDLTRLRILRNSADYDLVFDGDPSIASQIAIRKAKKTLTRIAEFPENIVDEIKSNCTSKPRKFGK